MDTLDSEEIHTKKVVDHLEECVDNLESIVEIYGNDRNTSLFLNIYGKDLAQLFKDYELPHAILILDEVDPDNHSIYSIFLNK